MSVLLSPEHPGCGVFVGRFGGFDGRIDGGGGMHRLVAAAVAVGKNLSLFGVSDVSVPDVFGRFLDPFRSSLNLFLVQALVTRRYYFVRQCFRARIKLQRISCCQIVGRSAVIAGLHTSLRRLHVCDYESRGICARGAKRPAQRFVSDFVSICAQFE